VFEINSNCKYALVMQPEQKSAASKLDQDVCRVKFLVSQFDLVTFGNRQFKIKFVGKGSVFLSGSDLLELTDSRSELNLIFEPIESESVSAKTPIKIVRSSQQGSYTSRSDLLEDVKSDSKSDNFSPTSSSQSKKPMIMVKGLVSSKRSA
jgi:hypothetical protein